jgi:hypothetical protein
MPGTMTGILITAAASHGQDRVGIGFAGLLAPNSSPLFYTPVPFFWPTLMAG